MHERRFLHALMSFFAGKAGRDVSRAGGLWGRAAEQGGDKGKQTSKQAYNCQICVWLGFVNISGGSTVLMQSSFTGDIWGRARYWQRKGSGQAL